MTEQAKGLDLHIDLRKADISVSSARAFLTNMVAMGFPPKTKLPPMELWAAGAGHKLRMSEGKTIRDYPILFAKVSSRRRRRRRLRHRPRARWRLRVFT